MSAYAGKLITTSASVSPGKISDVGKDSGTRHMGSAFSHFCDKNG